MDKLRLEIDEAERKAIDSLARYKFAMFGYWAGIWVHLNRISGENRPNPFRSFVLEARRISNEQPGSNARNGDDAGDTTNTNDTHR